MSENLQETLIVCFGNGVIINDTKFTGGARARRVHFAKRVACLERPLYRDGLCQLKRDLLLVPF